jgi:hypothetical protein
MLFGLPAAEPHGTVIDFITYVLCCHLQVFTVSSIDFIYSVNGYIKQNNLFTADD